MENEIGPKNAQFWGLKTWDQGGPLDLLVIGVCENIYFEAQISTQ